ncbi:restriction endonuclease [Streptomyces canus]
MAVSKDPVFNGECIIQAKRYSKLVGVESVRRRLPEWSSTSVLPRGC